MPDAAGEIVATWTTSHGHTVQLYRVRPRRLLGAAPTYGWRRLVTGDTIARSADPYHDFERCQRDALLVNPPADPRARTGRR